MVSACRRPASSASCNTCTMIVHIQIPCVLSVLTHCCFAAFWAVLTFGDSGPAITAHGSLDLKQEIQIQIAVSFLAGRQGRGSVAEDHPVGAGWKAAVHVQRSKPLHGTWIPPLTTATAVA
jgi:hypothetical protein